MRIPRTGIAGVDKALREVTTSLNSASSTSVRLGMYVGTKSAGFDATLIKVKVPMKLTSVFLDVDATLAAHASDYWKFQVAIYRPGFANTLKISPSVPFDLGTEMVSTNKYPIQTHVGLDIPFDEDLKVDDVVVFEATKVASASNLDSLYIQTDLVRAA